MRGLQGKTVLVTGAAGGIGRAICRRFAEEGARLIAFDIDQAGLDSLAEELRGTGATVRTACVDITDTGRIKQALDAAEQDGGVVDVLVNNAGWDRFGNFLDADEAARRRVIDVNLAGPINVTHDVAGRMVKAGRPGRIVTIASDAGRVGSSGQAVYSACKGGLIALTKTLARELARKNVLLNAVCPGPTRTPMIAGIIEGESGRKIIDAMTRAIPLKRLGEPEDLPGMVAFLASDDASFITGQVISVSGGLTMHG